MCGIVGIWNFNQPDITDVEFDRFVDSQKHRGPDNRGVFHEPETGLRLGHRRLAILDPSPKGHQPMSYANGRYWITYDGKVYNFLELRVELEKLGHSFVSDSDTEVILAAYRQWGEDCQLKFNGMWAFAIWDSQERELFLSRDRFGIKPLHYIWNNRSFAFASEMKAFLTLSSFDYAFDHDIVAEVLCNITGIETTEFCLLKGVKRLMGGHCLTIREGQQPRIRRWWNTLDHLEEVPSRFEEQIEKFRELFFDACRLRMRSDVPLATSLSGGLDSSTVLCTINEIGKSQRFTERMTNDWQKAFVAYFPGTNLDEREYAEKVIESQGAIPFYKEIRIEDCLSEIDEMVFHFEEIYFVLLAGQWLVYKEMRDNGVTVGLEGNGGDELLGGYHFIIEEEIRNALFPWPKISRYLDLKNTLVKFEGGSSKIETSLGKDLRFLKSQYQKWLLKSPVGEPIKKAYWLIKGKSAPALAPGFLLNPPKAERLHPEIEHEKLDNLTRLNRSLFSYFHHSTGPTIIRNSDRAAMGHGVEVRFPFADWRLVCFSFSLPDESKIGAGYAKRILRESMRNIVPDSVRLRTNKIGFTSPMAQWFEGALRGFLLDSVNSRDFLASDIWNGPALREFVETCVHKQEWLSLERVWPYLNAYILMKQFDKHWSTSRD